VLIRFNSRRFVMKSSQVLAFILGGLVVALAVFGKSLYSRKTTR